MSKVLRGVPKVLSPELLKPLCEMGHGDLLVLGDVNFPAAACARKSGAVLVRADGLDCTELLDAVLRLTPLDYCEKSAYLMRPDRPVQVPIWDDYRRIISRYEPRGESVIGELECFSYYEMAEEAACIVQTGETAIYANIALRKGVME